MDGSRAVTGAAEADGPKLQKILNRVFRCAHRQQTRPITLRGECYAVCLDCGQRLAYDFQAMRFGASASGDGPSRPDAEGETTRAPEVPVPKSVSSVPDPSGTAIDNSRPFRRTVGSMTKEVLWLGVLAIGLTSGFLYWADTRPEPEKPAAPKRVPPSISAGAVKSPPGITADRHDTASPPSPKTSDSVAKPTVSNASKPTTAEAMGPAPLPVSETAGSAAGPRLDSKGPVVVLGREAAAALELLRYPGRLSKLIRRGSLFTVPRGTAIKLGRTKRGVIHVRIIDGAMAGQEGWAQAGQIMP